MATARSKRSADALDLRRVQRTNETPVAAATDELALRFARCRALGHSWQDVGFADPSVAPLGEYNAVGYVNRCARCGMERTKWMGRYGSRGTLRYSEVDGYARRGDDALSLVEWRRTWLVAELGDRA